MRVPLKVTFGKSPSALYARAVRLAHASRATERPVPGRRWSIAWR